MSQLHSQQPTLIVVDNVSYRIGKHDIIKNLTLQTDHRRVGIVGRNGSGKSTLARLLCGLIEPSEGELYIAGVDVAADRHSAIRTVGMLFQNPDHQVIFPTVEEELVFGLHQLGQSRTDARRAAHNMLQKFECKHWADISVSTLSQGQRHLVCLMAVLLMKPSLIVLDEPYAGLDIPTTIQLKTHIDAIDASVVHISHDPEMLKTFDHVLWIENGEVLAQGEPQDILPAFVAKMEELGAARALI